MNTSREASTTVDLKSVSFSPLPQRGGPSRRPRVELASSYPQQRMVRELQEPLLELARRARRVAPAETGAVLLLAGGNCGTGTSTIAQTLAKVAVAEFSVLLIDANLSNGALSRQTGRPFLVGWEEAVRGRCAFEEALYAADDAQRFAFAPLKHAVADPNGLLMEDTLRQGLVRLRGLFDLIVIDGGSVFEYADRWASWADAALLVCDIRRTPQADWSRAWDRLEEGGTHVLGIVETSTSFPAYQS